jgi:hypothetical protein
MKSKILGPIFSMMLFLISSCAWGGQMILESKDVQFFKVSDEFLSKSNLLKISGLAFHSSLVVKEITTSQEGDVLNIYVHLVPAKKGLTGNFSYEISFPETVKIVRFGNNNIIIWKRGTGPIDLNYK